MSTRFPVPLDVDDFATVNRRRLLRGLGSSALVTATGGLFCRPVWGSPVFSAYPFALGVASGDPAPDGFVIWTRIAPKPLERGGGMPKSPVEVEWSVATDERMREVVQKGTAIAHPELGHAVHVEVDGLEPARDYFYQFTIGEERSRVGRARTLPPRRARRSRKCASPSPAASATRTATSRPIAASPPSDSISFSITATTSTSIACCGRASATFPSSA